MITLWHQVKLSSQFYQIHPNPNNISLAQAIINSIEEKAEMVHIFSSMGKKYWDCLAAADF